MGRDIDDWRLIPYLQRHEFEALVLASLDALKEVLDPEEHQGVRVLLALIAAIKAEDVNDGEDTAPSKRLEATSRAIRKRSTVLWRSRPPASRRFGRPAPASTTG